MAKLNLNASVITELPHPDAGQRLYFDTKIRGFGVRVTKTTKSYFAEGRVSGRKRRVTIGSSTVLRVDEARREAKKLLGQMAADIDPNAAKAEARARSITLAEALDLYLTGRDLREATKTANGNFLRRNFGDWMNKEIRTITPAMVVQRFDRLTENSSASVANGSFRVFRACWNYARAATATNTGRYSLPENPTTRLSDLRKWHKPKRRQIYLTDDQYPLFFEGLDTSNSPVFADYMELLLRCGLRRNEAACLTWDDVNFENRTFTIVAERAKNGKELVLPMATQIEAIFLRRLRAGASVETVFRSTTGVNARYDPRKSLQHLREGLRDNISYHDLRRSFAVIAERLDISYSKIKRLMNHSQGSDVTLGYLVNTDPETLRLPMQRIGNEIDRLAGL